MKVNIEIFDCIDDIWKRHRGNLKDDAWAAAIGGGFRKPTISELRRLSRITKKQAGEDIGRSCTLDKIMRLMSGLIGLLGGDIVKKELIKCLEKTSDLDTRMVLKILLITKHAPKEIKANTDNFLDVIIKAIK